MEQRIWLIGGTQESAQLAIALVNAAIPMVVTVTTEAARSLYPSSPLLRCQVGRLTAEDLPQFLQAEAIAAVLDASHPFAVAISELAIATATQLHLPYLRYERPSVSAACKSGASGIRLINSLDDLLHQNLLQDQRVLLTLGYRLLDRFRPWQSRSTLFARILPSVTALEAAIAAGFTPDRLIALRPPISADLERSLWQQWQISMVVTKASGAPGGEAVKRHLAEELSISLILLARPAIIYPQQTSDFKEAIEFSQTLLSCAKPSAGGLPPAPPLSGGLDSPRPPARAKL